MDSNSNLKGTQIMTKMLLTIISCVFLCVACSDVDYKNDYYEQQIDELHSRVIAAENEIANLQTQLEESNAVEVDDAIEVEEVNTIEVDEETNTTDIAINCTADLYLDNDFDNPMLYSVHITLYAQIDDVLEWNDVPDENYCKDASTPCTQNIYVSRNHNDESEGQCYNWTCINNECVAHTYASASKCDISTIENLTQFYSITHRPCAYRFDDLHK